MDKYSASQLQSFPAAGVGILRTPDGRYVSPQQYADEYYPGLVLPAGLVPDDPVSVVVAQAQAPTQSIPVVVTASPVASVPAGDIRNLFSSSRSVPEPADTLRTQIAGAPRNIDPGMSFPSLGSNGNLFKFGLVAIGLWLLLRGAR